MSPYDASKMAFQVIAEIYAWFGIEQEDIPYLSSTRDGVDPGCFASEGA